jgi:light-regulated signal transduction histidine kinase (bacteriophytochrome)
MALACAPLLCLPLRAAQTDVQTPEDSPKVSSLLLEAKEDAVRLESDGRTMQTLTRQKYSRQSHKDQIAKMQHDVDDMGILFMELNQERAHSSAWQQLAIDRVNPMLIELTMSIQRTAQFLNESPNDLQSQKYHDYIQASAENASSMASLISDFVAYGQTKKKFDELTQKLQITPGYNLE